MGNYRKINILAKTRDILKKSHEMFLRSYILILQNVVTKMSLQCSYAGEPGLALSNFFCAL